MLEYRIFPVSEFEIISPLEGVSLYSQNTLLPDHADFLDLLKFFWTRFTNFNKADGCEIRRWSRMTGERGSKR